MKKGTLQQGCQVCNGKKAEQGNPSVTAAKDCHCERSVAISAFNCLDCFVVSLLAMTKNRQSPLVSECIPIRN